MKNKQKVLVKNSSLIKIGLKIKLYRTKLNYTQSDLANLAQLHRTYIGSIERAEKNITIMNLIKISEALKINITELFL